MATKPSDLTPGQWHLLVEALGVYASMANGNSREHGFWDDYDATYKAVALGAGSPDHEDELRAKYQLDIKLSKIALMHSELGEMTEGVRKPHEDEHCSVFTSEEVEAADVFIRLMDYVGEFGLRFADAVMAKMEYNAGRTYKHGKGA